MTKNSHYESVNDLMTQISSHHQGPFLRRQALRPPQHQTFGGRQTGEQEADEEGPGDSGTQPAPEAPTPAHSHPVRHVRNLQQLRPGPGDVSTELKQHGYKYLRNTHTHTQRI